MCRSRRELSNEYFLAKSGFDTAENEPCEVRRFELSEMLNLNFEISKLLFATQKSFVDLAGVGRCWQTIGTAAASINTRSTWTIKMSAVANTPTIESFASRVAETSAQG